MNEWQLIIQTVQDEGHVVPDTPALLQPHSLSPDGSGALLLRKCAFIRLICVGLAAMIHHLEVVIFSGATDRPAEGSAV